MRHSSVLLVITGILGGCIAASSPPDAVSPEPSPARPETTGAHTSSRGIPNSISGVVLDAHAQPVKAHVALITSSGSQSLGTENGEFFFDGLREPEYVLTAWTDDGLWTVLPLVSAGASALALSPDQPGAYVDVTMTGRPSARFAVFHDSLRFADRTLRNGKPMRFLVPSGSTSYLLYGKDLKRDLDLELAPGATEQIQFELSD